MEVYDIIIVGCGLSGAVLAERYANQLNKRVLIVEKRAHIGGNCYDYKDSDTGIRISKYGPHFFHTNSEKVWNYVQRHAEWVKWEPKIVGRIGEKQFPIPVNISTVNILLNTDIQNEEEMNDWLNKNVIPNSHPQNGKQAALSQVGEQLYELIYKYYTKKNWGIYPEELDASITQRVPIRTNFDTRYFTDKYQALPKEGFTGFFERILDHDNIKVLLNSDYFELKDKMNGFEKLFFTGPIDQYYVGCQLGELEYRSLRFENELFADTGFYQDGAVINYPSLEKPFTRIVEYKHILNQKSSDTIICREYGTAIGDPYYPVINDENKKKYKAYEVLSQKENNIYFIGRLANFQYINMDEAILKSLQLFEQIEAD